MNRRKKTTVAQKPGESGMPAYRMSLPVLLLLFVFFTVLGGGLAYLAVMSGSAQQAPTAFVLATNTVAEDTLEPTDTLVPTITNTPEPIPTLEPISYTVKEGDSCDVIAGTFNIPISALVAANEDLSASCFLVIGQVLSVPQPTPLPTTDAFATQAARQTEAACPIEYVTVQEGETIEEISKFTRVPVNDILEYNGKPSGALFAGEVLGIPTCKETTDLAGQTYTPSPAPDYPAPQLLQPLRGTYFSTGEEIILQWTASSELRANEYFVVTIFDSTDGGEIVHEETVKDTRLIVPQSLQPTDNSPHIFTWKVGIIAQIGEDANGDPIYRQGGPDSEVLYFGWEGN